MKNLIIGIGQCGINITNDIPGIANMQDWSIFYVDNLYMSLQELNRDHYDNVYILCGFGGEKAFQRLDEVIEICRPVTTNLLCFGAVPYNFEGKERCKRAQKIVKKIKQVVDITVVQPNEALLKDKDLSEINAPIVSAIVAAIKESHRPLFYSLYAILETTGTPTGLKPTILTEHIGVFINEARLKVLVNEALGIEAQIPSPDGVRSTMQGLWNNYKNGECQSSKIFEVQLPPPEPDEI